MTRRDPAAQHVLKAVRDATNALHTELDQHVDGQRILDGVLERDRYVRMLRAHYALHQLVATHAAATLADGTLRFLDWPACERLPALQQDLDRLGADSNLDASELPSVPIDGAAVAAGLIYVVEGACHGTGQMLRALSANADFQRWSAEAFMQVSKASVARRWPRTLELVQTFGADDLDGVTRGAIGGYSYYRAAWDLAA